MSLDDRKFGSNSGSPDDGLNLDEFKELINEEPGAVPSFEKEAQFEPEPVHEEKRGRDTSDELDEFKNLIENKTPSGAPEYDFTQLTRRVEIPKEQPDVREEQNKKADKAIKVERRQRTGCLGGLIFFAFIVGISVLLAVVGWIAATDVLALGKEDLTAVVEINEGDEIKDIAEKLEEAGIIRYPWLFRLFCVFAKADEKISSSGSFELNTTMDYRAIISAMGQSSSTRLTVTIVIPEGYTQAQILQTLADNGVAELSELQDTAANYDFEYSFLQDIELGLENRLEGYLFPDTYEFYVGESTITAINKMLANFNNKFDSEMRDQAAEMGYSMHEILTIASLIEREAANDSERATIASVIYNRLNSDSFPNLQIDASIQYVLPEGEIVTQEDYYTVDSPYNTYLYEGLPPGPIACPGLASIVAALNPESTNYYYYALGEDGQHHFSTTAEEHEAFVAQMQNAA